MTIDRGYIYGGTFMIVAGIGAILGRYFGFQHIWFIYPLAAGILMIAAPWATSPEQARSTRVAGIWTTMGGALSGLVILTGISWSALWPLWMIGSGVTSLLLAKRQTA